MHKATGRQDEKYEIFSSCKTWAGTKEIWFLLIWRLETWDFLVPHWSWWSNSSSGKASCVLTHQAILPLAQAMSPFIFSQSRISQSILQSTLLTDCLLSHPTPLSAMNEFYIDRSLGHSLSASSLCRSKTLSIAFFDKTSFPIGGDSMLTI